MKHQINTRMKEASASVSRWLKVPLRADQPASESTSGLHVCAIMRKLSEAVTSLDEFEDASVSIDEERRTTGYLLVTAPLRAALQAALHDENVIHEPGADETSPPPAALQDENVLREPGADKTSPPPAARQNENVAPDRDANVASPPPGAMQEENVLPDPSANDTSLWSPDHPARSYALVANLGCGFCPKQLMAKISRTRHIRIIHGRDLYKDKAALFKCHLCLRAFLDSEALRRHLQDSPPGCNLHRCPTCDQGFGKVQNLVQHMSGVHSDGETSGQADDGEEGEVTAEVITRAITIHDRHLAFVGRPPYPI